MIFNTFSESGKKSNHSKPKGLTSEFFEAVWYELKTLCYYSIKKVFVCLDN